MDTELRIFTEIRQTSSLTLMEVEILPIFFGRLQRTAGNAFPEKPKPFVTKN